MSGRRAKQQRRQARARLAAQAKPAPELRLPQRYELLHYPGDLTGADGLQPGRVLGHDELGRPYEVLDAEHDPATGRTTVHLQYATADSLRAAEFLANLVLPGGATVGDQLAPRLQAALAGGELPALLPGGAS